MLRTNLSTRPFYNIRAVQVALGGLALVVALMTIINLVQVIRLTSSERALGARANQAETDAQRLRGEAQRIRSQINARELSEVATAAQEANAIIDLRAFSWSDLFAQIDVLATPATACAAFGADEEIPATIAGRDATWTGAEPLSMFANVLGAPAISIPAGLTRDGLPVGLQLVGRRCEDKLLLRLARALEAAAPWPRLAPGY